MKILISPAKTMVVDEDTFCVKQLPMLLEEARRLTACLKELDAESLKKLWGCSEKLYEENAARLRETDAELSRNLTPALIAYEGIQYQYLSPKTLEGDALYYLEKHLRILSGLYGVLRPMDGIVPYRLEMQAKLAAFGEKNLYGFWENKLYDALCDMYQPKTAQGEKPGIGQRTELVRRQTDGLVLFNLASKEYAKAIEPYLQKKDRMVTCFFYEEQNGTCKQKATLAKMARGEMTRFLAQQQAETPEAAKEFHSLGFAFCPGRSNETEFVFIKKNEGKPFGRVKRNG